MQARLRVSHQRANLNVVRLLPLTVVGRSLECHLKIASAQVSRRHCQIMLRPDGVYVEDLKSSNGTFLDGVRLPPQVPTYVASGSQLDIGPARFVVEYELTDDSITGSGSQSGLLSGGRKSGFLAPAVASDASESPAESNSADPLADFTPDALPADTEGSDSQPSIPFRVNVEQSSAASKSEKPGKVNGSGKSFFGLFRRQSPEQAPQKPAPPHNPPNFDEIP